MDLTTSFDPISLLDDSDKELFSSNGLQKLRNDLLHKLWDYLTIKLSEGLTETQLDEVLDTVGIQQRARALKKYIPDFDSRVDNLIEEFRQEFKKGED